MGLGEKSYGIGTNHTYFLKGGNFRLSYRGGRALGGGKRGASISPDIECKILPGESPWEGEKGRVSPSQTKSY